MLSRNLAGCPSPTTALAILLAVLVTGCASRPEGVLAPVATITTDTAKIDLLVATTREPTKGSGVFFTGELGANLSLANVVVSMPPTGQTAGGSSPGNDPHVRLARRSLALRPAHSRRYLYVTGYTQGFSHFVTSMTAPVASGWSVRRMGLAPHGKRRLLTGHT